MLLTSRIARRPDQPCLAAASILRVPDEARRMCWRVPIFALLASSAQPFGALWSYAPRAWHELPNASIVRQKRDILEEKRVLNA
jgi:hypothetical protein